MRDLINKTLQWANDRNLLDNTGPERQILKCMSELGEFSDEVLKGNYEKMRMELGDVMVTLVLVANKCNLDLEECLSHAYEKISARKGVTKNGIFMKEEDT